MHNVRIEEAYAKTATLPPRQRANWPGARKQAGTPLDAEGNVVNPRQCERCGGVGHHRDRCPCLAADKDPQFAKLTAEQKEKTVCFAWLFEFC